MTSSWPWFLTLALALVAGHGIPTLPAVRQALVGALGEKAYRVVYSLFSLLLFGAFVWAYLGLEPGPQLYLPPPGARWAAVLLMPLAIFLILARLTTSAPWSARRSGDQPEAARAGEGIYGLTRSPGSIGLLLWIILHLFNTGDLRRVALFLVFAAIAGLALVKNEVLLRRAAGTGDPAAKEFLARSRLLPRPAALRGGLPSGMALWRALAALLIYAALLLAHPHVLGVDPLIGL